MEELSDRQSTTSECQLADDNIDDTQMVEHPSPVTPQSVNPLPDPSLDVSGGRSSQELKDENDDCGTSSKKKKKRKKKKKELVSADIGSSVDDNNVDGSVVYSSPPITGQTESEGKREGLLPERISGLQSGESENPHEFSTVTKKKKKKKKKKKETAESADPFSSTYADEHVSGDGENEARATQIANNVPSQLSVSTTAVQETQEIGNNRTENHKDSDLKSEAAILRTNVDNQQRVESGQNTLAFPDSNVQDNLNVQGDPSPARKKKKKKKKKGKKKQESDDDTQPPSEITGAVLASDDHSEMVSETPSPNDQPGQKNGKEQVSSQVPFAKEKSCVSDVMPETMQGEKDSVTTATSELCKKGPATSGYRDDPKPAANEDNSCDSQSIQEMYVQINTR